MIQKINDERLKRKNLENTRILFIVQTAGIIGILGYELVTKGMDEMTGNPLWFLLILTGIVSAYLSMSISVDHESDEKSPKKGLLISLAASSVIAIGFGAAVTLTADLNTGILVGAIVFICFIVPYFYLYYLRRKQED
ncbi:hypothetical protein [Salimicrobium humidisoli]|uniref:Branched-chain amino acid ABC transporter substrate-binding protein n=1 Tax=Salimicrobium humidisoli TaxID=2029857 RepID=A0ABX4HSS1_9BACI|nr:hypothetical protein [Salimicrobium humidisoli]PBB06277.1 hypothetical protein CKW00_04405 [Salimicrobium humidisoli]